MDSQRPMAEGTSTLETGSAISPTPESLEAARQEAITAWRTATSEQLRATAYGRIAHYDKLLGKEDYNGRH